MNKQTLDISLAHYMYFPSVDYAVVKEIWDRLVQMHNLASSDSEDIFTEGKALSHTSPIILKNERIGIGLLIARGITTVELLLFQSTASPTEEFKELENIRGSLGNLLEYLAGETTIKAIDGRIQDSTPEQLIEPLIGNVGVEHELSEIILYDSRVPQSQRHYYAVFPKDKSKAPHFLVSDFPLIDAILFKLAKQAAYFKDQRTFINGKKSDSDLSLSDILNHWTKAKAQTEHKIDHLESDVEMLSSMYSELVGNLKLIKKAHDTMSRDLERLNHQVRKLNTDPRALANFEAAYTAEYSNLLSDLELDDKLLHRSLDDTRATIEVVRTRIELERSRESFLLQQEGVSVQTAAGFIELFVVWFYTLEAWELMASKAVFEQIAIVLRLGIDTMFAIAVVAFTHYAAKLIRNERSNLGLGISGLNIIVALIFMVLATSYAAKG